MASSPLRADSRAHIQKPSTIAELADAYGRSDYATFSRDVANVGDADSVIHDATRFHYTWSFIGNHRQATFYLELTAALEARDQVDVTPLDDEVATDSNARDLTPLDGLLTPAAEMLKRVDQSVPRPERLGKPEPGVTLFESEWLRAEIALLEGIVNPNRAERFIAAIRKRNPDEPRVVLALAIEDDQRTSPLNRAHTSPEDLTAALHDYASADAFAGLMFPALRPEVRIRQGWLTHRMGKDQDALALLDAVDTKGLDGALAYYRSLFRGRVLESLHRPVDAEAAYRAALELMPSAQSPRIALTALLFRSPTRSDAEALAASIETSGPGADPWWVYWQGDYRNFRSIIAQLHEDLR